MSVMIAGLVLSGLTAFPLQAEVELLSRLVRSEWIARVSEALTYTGRHYPFLAYGTDWLAFAHLIIAVLFVGPWRDPVRNRWVIEWGLFACAAVIPLALICGHLRGIPLYWRLIDCSFGVLGFVPLWICRDCALRMERISN